MEENCFAQGYDQNSLEQCLPLKSFTEVLNWKEPASCNWAQFVKPLKGRAEHCLKKYSACGNSRKLIKSYYCPKTLVCHDMKGGYLNDRHVNGHNNLDEYKFISWPCIDTFVYFSHERVTIPPLSWLNAGHLHGVRVLGTIITEGKSGINEWITVCKESYLLDRLAINLALICRYYGFDGYLLNIENKLDPEFVAGPFKKFIVTLNDHLKRISSDKLLLWYDSVTINGDLKWQNKLNERNRDFFNICDGIFLNYCWDEVALIESLEMAGERKYDVYVGIDVFGRGCLGGGGFTSCEAFNLIRKHDLSAAIFAPGWVHENCEEDEKTDCRDFMFWELISEYLYTHGPSSLPFETSFCRGFGYQTYEHGAVVKSESWFNQSQINHLPALLTGLHEVEDDCCLAYYDKDSFSGGGCLLVSQKTSTKKCDVHIDCLLVCDFSTNSEEAICIEMFTKPLLERESHEMAIIVSTSSLSEDSSIKEVKEEKSYSFEICNSDCEKKNGWHKSSFELQLGTEHVISIGCKLTGKKRPVLIGYLKVYSIKKS